MAEKGGGRRSVSGGWASRGCVVTGGNRDKGALGRAKGRCGGDVFASTPHAAHHFHESSRMPRSGSRVEAGRLGVAG